MSAVVILDNITSLYGELTPAAVGDRLRAYRSCGDLDVESSYITQYENPAL